MERVKARGWRKGVREVVISSIIFMEKSLEPGGMLDA